jgi:ribosome-binding factor A
MAKNWRQDQLGEVITHELSDLIRTRVKDPRVGFASITGVEVSADLRHAKVFVSVMGNDQERQGTLAALTHAAGFLRHELAQRLTIRYTPEITFRLDESIAHGVHLIDLINKVSSSDTVADGQAAPGDKEPVRASGSGSAIE